MVGLEGQSSILALRKFEPAVPARGMVWHCQIIKPFRFGEHIHRIIDLFPCIWLWRVSLCFIAKCPWSGSFGWHVKVQNPPKGDPKTLCYAIPLEKLNKTKHGNIIDLWFERNMFNKATLPETNKAAENGWLEVERRSFPFWMACFQVLTVSFRKGIRIYPQLHTWLGSSWQQQRPRLPCFTATFQGDAKGGVTWQLWKRDS